MCVGWFACLDSPGGGSGGRPACGRLPLWAIAKVSPGWRARLTLEGMDPKSIVELVHGLIPWARIPVEVVACLLLTESAMRVGARVAVLAGKSVDQILGRSKRRSVRRSFKAWGRLVAFVVVVALLIVCAI